MNISIQTLSTYGCYYRKLQQADRYVRIMHLSSSLPSFILPLVNSSTRNKIKNINNLILGHRQNIY